ncbi:DUF6452 family protein [Flavobacterium terrigena]|uniref:Lipoprotein n=1 Tax=Flavobacterium terrigena TaxID=402734 RepID=A0A1H6Y554_9FLAO|nr:DUF6452 family protein [Flavobacterium terrigena]SEJ32260.1 hypothetical protein SAMN05660918_0010 [Flavobacterium terrigena]
MKKLFLLLLISFFFSGCEKDDICDETTPTTPKVIIEFYDSANPTVLKNVVNLGIFNTDFTIGFGFNGVSKAKIPLKTFQDSSVFYFIENGSDEDNTNDNQDEVIFNYTRKTAYISRACGFKTIYTLDATNPVSVTADGNNWIQNIIVSQPNIENENETHVKIYF